MTRPLKAGGEARAVKLKDVADHAGCSPATASRVLNGNEKVGAYERQRVLVAAQQLGYIPNHSARALRSQSTNLVGAIIPTLDHAIYARMVSGLEERLASEGKSVVISTTDYDLAKELVQAKILVGRGAESVVLVGSEHNPETTEFLRRAGVDLVFTYTCELGSADASVGFNNRQAAGGRCSLSLGTGTPPVRDDRWLDPWQ
jgi:LacI family transcriptional regulator